MPITKNTIRIYPLGIAPYQSQALTNKRQELTDAGDIISKTVITVSNDTNTYVVNSTVWKDENAFNSFSAWLASSGELTLWNALLTANDIKTISDQGNS